LVFALDEHTERKKVIREHRFEKMLSNSKFTLEQQSNCNSGVDVPRAFLKFENGVDVPRAFQNQNLPLQRFTFSLRESIVV
jgi:hypothetical protein